MVMVEREELLAMGGVPGGVGERACKRVVVTVDALVLMEIAHGVPGVWRAGIRVIAQEIEIAVPVVLPSRVVPVAPPVMREDRLIPAVAGIPGKAGIEAVVEIAGIEVVAKVIMTVIGPHEEAVGEQPGIDYDTRSVVITRLVIDITRETNRCEEHAALVQGMVPVAIQIDISARGPAIA